MRRVYLFLRSYHLALLFFSLISGWSVAETLHFETAVTPRPNEDIASECKYSLTIPDSTQPVAAVWVIFDRGHDVHDLYSDAAVLAFARRYRVALLLHGHCPGKAAEDHGDMNMDPAKGLGRALSTALEQFSATTHHPELARTKLLFLGFSGAGPLSARLVAGDPDRTLAAILSSPGHYDPMGIDKVDLSSTALAVPELILVGSADDVSGTSRPYGYFKKYGDLGAPWAFVVQNNATHCCTANAKDLMLHWLAAIIDRRSAFSSSTLPSLDHHDGWLAFMKTEETETRDSFGLRTFKVTAAKVERSTDGIQGWESAGWLPNKVLAKEWLAFVQKKQHPILPLH